MTDKSRVPTPLTKRDYAMLAEFRYALRRFLAFSENAAEAAGLAAQQHQALLAIKGFADDNSLTVGVLAERLSIRHHSAVGLVNRLSAAGFVVRGENAADRRQVLVTLTPVAEALLADLSLAHRNELKRLAPLLQTLLADLKGRD